MHSNTHPTPRSPRCWLVTSASSGIGGAIARRLAQDGDRVIAWGRNPVALADLQRSTPGVIATQAFDLCDEAALNTALDTALNTAMRHGLSSPGWAPLSGLVHCAGQQDDVLLEDANYSAQAMAAELRLNLWVPMVLCRLLLPALRARPEAVLILVSSALAFAPKRRSAVYNASKAGLHAFSESLRAQLRGSGVQLMELIPPLVNTPMTAGRSGRKIAPDQVAHALAHTLRRGRLPPRLWVGPARALPWLLRIAPNSTRHFFLKESPR